MSNLRRCRAGIIMLAIIVVLAWAFIPPVKLFINHGVAALASLDQQGIEHFIRAWGPSGGARIILPDDFAGHHRPAPGVYPHLCQCVSFWCVLGRIALVEQRHGRSDIVLLSCPRPWA